MLFRFALPNKLRFSSLGRDSFPLLSSPLLHHEQFLEAFTRFPAILNPFVFGVFSRRWSVMAEGGIAICGQSSRDQRCDTEMSDQTMRRFKHPAWPEWTLFLNLLKSVTSIDNENPKQGIWDVRELFSDVSLLKHAFVKFSQVHESILERLPRNELDALAKYEFPRNDERTAAARMRVQKYLQMKQNNVSSSSGVQSVPAKLKDVMRLIYRAVSDTPFIDHSEIERKEVLVQILQNLVVLSSAAPTTTSNEQEDSGSKNVGINKESDQLYETRSVQKESSNSSDSNVEEWKCSRCSFVNVSPKESCAKCNQNVGTNVSQQQEDSEPRKFQSIKERVDARRARLERERIQKEAASAASFLDQNATIRPRMNGAVSGIHVSSPTVHKACDEMHDSLPAKNFHDLDAIVASLDSDSDDGDDELTTAQCSVRRSASSISSSGKTDSRRNGGRASTLDSDDDDLTIAQRTVRRSASSISSSAKTDSRRNGGRASTLDSDDDDLTIAQRTVRRSASFFSSSAKTYPRRNGGSASTHESDDDDWITAEQSVRRTASSFSSSAKADHRQNGGRASTLDSDDDELTIDPCTVRSASSLSSSAKTDPRRNGGRALTLDSDDDDLRTGQRTVRRSASSFSSSAKSDPRRNGGRASTHDSDDDDWITAQHSVRRTASSFSSSAKADHRQNGGRASTLDSDDDELTTAQCTVRRSASSFSSSAKTDPRRNGGRATTHDSDDDDWITAQHTVRRTASSLSSSAKAVPRRNGGRASTLDSDSDESTTAQCTVRRSAPSLSSSAKTDPRRNGGRASTFDSDDDDWVSDQPTVRRSTPSLSSSAKADPRRNGGRTSSHGFPSKMGSSKVRW